MKIKEKGQKKEPKTGRAAIKALRTARRKLFYSTQFQRTEKNQRRRLRRHLRSHPMDVKNVKLYERIHGGRVSDFGLTGRGKHRVQRASNEAKQRLFDAALESDAPKVAWS